MPKFDILIGLETGFKRQKAQYVSTYSQSNVYICCPPSIQFYTFTILDDPLICLRL